LSLKSYYKRVQNPEYRKELLLKSKETQRRRRANPLSHEKMKNWSRKYSSKLV